MINPQCHFCDPTDNNEIDSDLKNNMMVRADILNVNEFNYDGCKQKESVFVCIRDKTKLTHSETDHNDTVLIKNLIGNNFSWIPN